MRGAILPRVTAASNDFDYEAALAGCARGQGADLQRLYQQESPRLLGVVQRMVRNMPLAEDIVHDAFVNIWKRAASFDASRGEARGWIYAIARNLALNSLRDNQRELAAEDDVMEALDASQSLQAWRDTQDEFAWQGSAERMQPCLERLEPVRRNCVLHAYVDGLSHSEIAARVGAPLGTVKAWIKRSLLNLRECLQ
jgi:RNA polymerase sigma-70 factor (ECF subfamily)